MEYILPDGKTPRQHLLDMQAQGNKPLAQKLNPGIDNVLGVRVPHVRALAKQIAKGDWQSYLASPGSLYMEERMLHGMVLGQIKAPEIDEYLRLIDRFAATINSWSVCDTFTLTGGKRFIEQNSMKLKSHFIGYLSDEREYVVRLGVVLLLRYFINGHTAAEIMTILETVKHPAYYVHMALAWAVAEAYIKAPDAILPRLATSPLPACTINKAISKIHDSFRVTPAQKAAAKAMRRK